LSETNEEILENVAEEIKEDVDETPIEVKVVKEKEKVVNEDADYEEFDISDKEIEEFENGN